MDSMLELLVGVIPLGIAAGITPALIAMQLLVVAEGVHWIRRAVWVIIANAIAFAIVISLVLLGFAQLPDAGTGHHGPLDAWIRMVAGGILLLASIWFFIPHAELAARARTSLERRLDHASTWVFFALAFYFAITDVSSYVVLLPAIHDVTSSDLPTAERAVVMVVLLILALQSTMLPPLVRLVGGAHVVPRLQVAYAWVMRNQFPIVGTVCALVGVFLIITGLARR